jgi:hypothetical protein
MVVVEALVLPAGQRQHPVSHRVGEAVVRRPAGVAVNHALRSALPNRGLEVANLSLGETEHLRGLRDLQLIALNPLDGIQLLPLSRAHFFVHALR